MKRKIIQTILITTLAVSSVIVPTKEASAITVNGMDINISGVLSKIDWSKIDLNNINIEELLPSNTVDESEVANISFNANGGKADYDKSLAIKGASYSSLPSAERKGYIFDGWYTAKALGSKVTASSIVPNKSNITLYAHWKEKINFTVKFDYNGGTGKTKNISVVKNKKYGKLPTAERKGYDFDGWYNAKKGGTKITEKKIVKIIENQTLYAHWKKTVVPEDIKASRVFWEKGTVTYEFKNIKKADGFYFYYDFDKNFKNKKYVDVKTDALKGKSYTFETKKYLKSVRDGNSVSYKFVPYVLDSAGKKVFGKDGYVYKKIYYSFK